MDPEKKPLERKSDSKEESKSIPNENMASTNFTSLYDPFRQPLTEIISKEGELIGITKSGELKRFEHNEDTRAIEHELCEHAKTHNTEMLDLRLTYYYNSHSGTLNDSLKYILCFYKVFFVL